MKSRRDRAIERLVIAMCLAMAVHYFGIPSALQYLITHSGGPAQPPVPPVARDQRWVEVHLDPVTTDPLLRPPAELPAEKEKVPEPPPPPPEIRPDGQVVEIPPPDREAVPVEAKYLSSYNSKVEREQVARNNEPPRPRMRKSERTVQSSGDDEAGDRADLRPTQATERPPGPGGDDERRGPARPDDDAGDPAARDTPALRIAEPERPVSPVEGERGRAMREAVAAEARRQLGRGAPAGGSSGGPPLISSLLPALGPQDFSRADGSIDHLDDMDQGETTLLNTREYKYAMYFNGVKNRVQQHWHAIDAHRLHDPYGRIFGVRDRVTIVEVTLNSDGSLDDVHLAKDSGVAFLDEVALRAFREAQPFPNPPAGLQDSDGRVRFRFGFHLEISGRGMRMFRY